MTQTTKSAKDMTSVGDIIKFDTDSFFVQYGEVTRKNPKTATVKDIDTGDKVLVSYSKIAGWR